MIDHDILDMDNLLARIRANGHPQPELPLPALSQGKIALVGLAHCGKRHLYNALWGWEALHSKTVDTLNLGLFTLVTLPSHQQSDLVSYFYPEDFDIIVYLLDASAGLRSEDFQWIARLRASKTPCLIVLNKSDLLRPEALQSIQADIEQKLAKSPIIVSAIAEKSVVENLLPTLLQMAPHLGSPLAAEMPTLRPQVVRQAVRQALIDLNRLFLEHPQRPSVEEVAHLQSQLVRQISEIYAQPSEGAILVHFARLLLQHLEQFFQKLNGNEALWFVWQGMVTLLTWLIAQSTLYHYDPSPVWVRMKGWF